VFIEILHFGVLPRIKLFSTDFCPMETNDADLKSRDQAAFVRNVDWLTLFWATEEGILMKFYSYLTKMEHSPKVASLLNN
jgi:hypothetical protein